MNSVDDSSVVTPADASNLSSPDSTSSEFSQPTVKLRVNQSPKNRLPPHDNRIFTADGHDPFLQTLDKEGRHLVETTGRTAQKSRASIRDASRYNEKCQTPADLEKLKGDCWPSYNQPRKCRSSTTASSFERHFNRGVKKRHSYGSESSRRSWEKSETKESPKRHLNFVESTMEKSRQLEKSKVDQWPVDHRPRKCHSSSSASSFVERPANRRVKKRHSYGAESTRRSWEKSELRETPKRYSAGDYLRQQILADLNSNELEGKTDEQIAEDRCNRVMAYLRRRGPDSTYVAPETRLMELREWTKLAHSTASAKAARRKDLDRVRNYLQEKIRSKMKEEKWENDAGANRWSSDCVGELSVQDIKTRYPDYKVDSLNFPTRRVRSDVNIRRDATSSESGQDTPIRARKGDGERRRGNPCRRTRSEIVPEMLIDHDDNEIKTRFYSFLGGRRNSWKTKSGLTFEKKLSLPSKTEVNLDRESDDPKNDKPNDRPEVRDNRDELEDRRAREKNRKKYCRRTRSDTVSEKLMEANSGGRRAKERSVSWSDRRKLHKKTSSVRTAAVLDSTSVDSEVDTATRGRAKGQRVSGRSLCSWREYKERRRQEQLREELAGTGGGEKARNARNAGNAMDMSNSTPPWKSLRKSSENDASRVSEEKKRREQLQRYPFANYRAADEATKTNENSLEAVRSSDNANDTETETILQENYLLLDLEENQTEQNYRSPTISRLQVNEYANPENSLFRHDETDCKIGYDTTSEIPGIKSPPIGRNLNSNVKKSDTFKVVDGSEKMTEHEDRSQREKGESSWSPSDSGPFFGASGATRGGADGTFARHSEGDDSAGAGQTNKDIAADYFRRVYELLKQRQEDARRAERPGISAPGRRDSDTTSTANCRDERDELLRKRRRRRRRDKNSQGEDVVAVSPGVRGDDDWRVQQLLVNNDPENLIFRRPQLQNNGQKRPRHPAPPIPTNCKINAKDISKYFDYPNKKNSPRNGVDENGRSKRSELIEQEQEQQQEQVDSNEAMGSNLSRHNGKGLTGRRTQSSGNLCDPKGKLNHVGKILVPCSSTQRERYKICGSLPNHLDDKEILEDDDPRENNNTISDTMVGTFGGTLPHKKRSLGVHFSDTGPTGTLDLVKHRSQDSLEGDPWRYQEGVDLDLVRCKHGNYDVVRKNQSADVVDGDSSSKTYGTLGRSAEGKCFRSADLDLVGTLPKRRPGESGGSALRQSFEARQNRSGERMDSGSDLLIKVMHKPDCELVKRHQFDRVVDLKLSRLAGGEPQDQGYASERSPEDEHPPSLPGQPFPKVTPEDTFRVTLQKSSRGLGLSVSGGGTAGPVRVKRLFPQQPAALSKKLQSGDILLAANGVPLTGLTNYEALEVLRTTPSTVELVVCRVPGDTSVTSPGAPPPPPARREPPSSLRILNPQPPLQIEPCGEFDIEMTKVAGSLGFTLRKVDSSALGHYVRALVREPALSDGRIQPGDKIVSVDGEPLSPMSHEEAVALLRQCGPRVKLRLYRDLAQTPVSALSPTEPDHPLRPPRTSLRQEAVDMLCDLAVRKLSPDTSHGVNSRQTSAASCHSPRRLRKPLSRTPTTENDNGNHLTFHPVHPSTASQAEASDTDQCSINTQATNSQSETPANDIIDPPPLYDVCDSSDSSRALSRPSFLDLTARPEKPHFRFSLESESDYTGPIVVTESDSNLTAECDYDDELARDALPLPPPPPPPPPVLSSDEQDNNLPSEPASMPPLLSTTRTTSGAFSYKNPAYQSANPTCGGIDNSAKNKTAHASDQDIPGKVLGAEDPAGSKGLLKWKGVMFAPNDEANETGGTAESEEAEKPSTTEVSARNAVSEDGNEVFTVELTRGWNSRLGFSLQPEGNSTVISVVHPDSVAAKDGRLMEGDVLIMVNDESVENMPTAEIIDLLRKIRGSIGITVRRKNRTKTVS